MRAKLVWMLETLHREISGPIRDDALKACDKRGRRYETPHEDLLIA